MLFHRLELEAFCHATEELYKVKEAMRNLVPFDIDEFSVQKTEGSFGNDLDIVTLHIQKQGDMKGLVRHLKSKLSEGFDVEKHIVEDVYFWVRFDKQKAFKNEFVLGGQDTIQLKGKVAAFPAKRENAVKIMKDAWS